MPDAPPASIDAADPVRAATTLPRSAPATPPPVAPTNGHDPALPREPERTVVPTIAGWPTRRWLWVLVAVLIALRLGAGIYLVTSRTDRPKSVLGGDAGRYDEIARTKGTPYRDFEVEYPPGALALIEAVHGPTRAITIDRLVATQLVLDLAVAGLLVWAWDRRTGLAYLILSTPLLAFPFLYVRIDLLSVFLALLGLALVRKGWERTGGASLAVAIFAKVWPLVVMPVLIVERKVRAWVAWAVAAAACGLAWVAWGGTDGPSQVLNFRGAKGWQIESTIGVFFHMADPHHSHPEAGAWRTAAIMPGWARVGLTALSGLTALVAWWLAWRRRRAGDDDTVSYGWAPMVSVVAMLVFAPILSPQYVLWFLPFAAIVAARGSRLVGGLTLAIGALSAWGFACIAAQTHGQWYAIYPLLVRNGLLVALLVVGLVHLSRPLVRATATASPSA